MTRLFVSAHVISDTVESVIIQLGTGCLKQRLSVLFIFAFCFILHRFYRRIKLNY
jgi:hypothetical protein